MKEYDIFLFDADNTLYDFDKASTHAIKLLFSEYGFNYSSDIPSRFFDIGIPLWERYEKGELSDTDLQKLRFTGLFDALEIAHDPVQFNARYMYELGKCSILIDGALEVCRQIAAAGKQIYIITNGFWPTHEARIQHSPIQKYMSGFFVSELIGHKKPSAEFFAHVLSYIPSADTSKILVVGDSLSADIAGGINVGMDTCWFNPHGSENRTGVVPTYEINELREILQAAPSFRA